MSIVALTKKKNILSLELHIQRKIDNRQHKQVFLGKFCLDNFNCLVCTTQTCKFFLHKKFWSKADHARFQSARKFCWTWQVMQINIVQYYMANDTSGKIARCDWSLSWRDFSVTTAGIMKIVNSLWTKTNSTSYKKMLKKFLCLKTKQNTEMSDEEHSDSEFYYPERARNDREKS